MLLKCFHSYDTYDDDFNTRSTKTFTAQSLPKRFTVYIYDERITNNLTWGQNRSVMNLSLFLQTIHLTAVRVNQLSCPQEDDIDEVCATFAKKPSALTNSHALFNFDLLLR